MTTIEEQIACVTREIKMRERVYPWRVSQRTMNPATADREMERMKAVLATLTSLSETGEATVHHQPKQDLLDL